jgi:PAS domain-containing protein
MRLSLIDWATSSLTPNKTWREQIKNISKVEPVARMMQGKTGVVGFYSPSVEKDMIAGFATVAGVGWGVMVPQPMEELEARVSGVKWAALIVIFIGLTVSAVIGWLVSGLIVRPVEAVAKAALAFAQGQDDVRVETPALAPSEVRQLTDAFNQMARDAAVNLTAQERQRSEQRVRGAIASLQEGFALYDADDRLVLYNEAYEKLNPHAAFVMEQGHLFEDVVRARVETGLIVAAKGREEEFIQERLEYHKNPEGTILREFSDGRWIILRGSRTPDGGVALTFVDVTEFKRAEQALREREDQYRGLVEGSIQGILVE